MRRCSILCLSLFSLSIYDSSSSDVNVQIKHPATESEVGFRSRSSLHMYTGHPPDAYVSVAELFYHGFQAQFTIAFNEKCQIQLFIDDEEVDRSRIFDCSQHAGYYYPRISLPPGLHVFVLLVVLCGSDNSKDDTVCTSGEVLETKQAIVQVLEVQELVRAHLADEVSKQTLSPLDASPEVCAAQQQRMEHDTAVCPRNGSICMQLHTSAISWTTDPDHGVVWADFSFNWVWQTHETALVLLDVWDTHWCSDFSSRSERLHGRIADFAEKARAAGVLVVHAPGGAAAEAKYREHPARVKVRGEAVLGSAPRPMKRVERRRRMEPPLQTDSGDGADNGCSSGEKQPRAAHTWRWVGSDRSRVLELHEPTGQSPAVPILPSDAIVNPDDGEEAAAMLRGRGVRRVLYAGFAANVCVLGRSASLVAMQDWGMEGVLLEDLTDVFANPLASPYLNPQDALKLHLEFVRKFIAPTTSTARVLFSSSARSDHDRPPPAA